MRIFISFILSLVALVATAQDYSISCTVNPEYNGKSVYLVDKNAGDTISSCEVVDGAFCFQGNISRQAVYDVVVNRIKGVVATVLVQNGTQADVNMTVRPAVISDNGGLNDKLVAIQTSINEHRAQLAGAVKRLTDEGKSEEEIQEMTKTETEALYDVYRNAIAANSDNILGAYALSLGARLLYKTISDFDAVMSKVEYATDFRSLTKMRIALYYGEKTKVGCKFIDFAGYSLGGEAVRLSDYVAKGKYVLVDFWASWCGPCKKEMPHIVAANSKYTGEQFMVVGVNVSDKEDSFKAALPVLGIEYPQIYIPRNSKDEDNAVLLYNVATIPHLMLIAPDGTILERGIQGAELDEKIASFVK